MGGADPAGRWLPHATTPRDGPIPGVDPRARPLPRLSRTAKKKRETGWVPAQPGRTRRTALWQAHPSPPQDLRQYLILSSQPVVLSRLFQAAALLQAPDVPRLAPGVVEQRRLPGPVGGVGQHPPAFAEPV